MAAIDDYAAAAHTALGAASSALTAAKTALTAARTALLAETTSNANLANVLADAQVLHARGTRTTELLAKLAEGVTALASATTASTAAAAAVVVANTAVDDAVAAIALVGAPP